MPKGFLLFLLAVGLCPLGLRLELGGFPQRKMGAPLADEGGKDAEQAELQASSFSLEQGRFAYKGDC